MSLKPGINENVSNKDYHANHEYLSSSVLKTILKSLSDYKRFYIDGEVKPQPANTAALEEGSLCHSMILEPHLVATDYAVYEGLFKRGEAWENFKANAPKGAVVLSMPQLKRVTELTRIYKSRLEAVKLVEGSLVEHTLCSELNGVPVKIRCDGIKPEEGYILDVKTTGYGSDLESFKQTMDNLSYQLSAALYCMVAQQHYERPFDFYFIVLSKRDKTCDVYKMSKETMNAGKLMVLQAIAKYKKAKQTGNWTDEQAPLAATCNNQGYKIEEV